jgi:hypothetical protein
VKFEEGHFYQDADGDVWQAQADGRLTFAAFGDGGPDVYMNDTSDASRVEDEYGPLTEVRPTGWEAVA